MMMHVKSALEDADVAILMHDISQPIEDFEAISNPLKAESARYIIAE